MKQIEVKKVYPIEGRTDFFKFVVMDNGQIAKGFHGNSNDAEMYFDNKEDAKRVADARIEVKLIRQEFKIKQLEKRNEELVNALTQIKLLLDDEYQFKEGFAPQNIVSCYEEIQKFISLTEETN